jgi:hypothetical protein
MFLTVRATSSIVAWLFALVAYKLLLWLVGRRLIPGPILISVILSTVVPVISVLTVPFGA